MGGGAGSAERGFTPERMESGNENTRKGGSVAHALAIAAASFGCISPAAYAQDAAVTVISDGSDHVVDDVDLNEGAPVGDATGQTVKNGNHGNSVFDADSERAWKKFTDELHVFEAYYIILPTVAFAMISLLAIFIHDLRDCRREAVSPQRKEQQ